MSPQNAEGIHVITTNYDTLLELFCDLAVLPIDTGFAGLRRRKPRPRPIFQKQYNRILVTEKRQNQFDHRLCKTVRLYKPHGSISWLSTPGGPIERCSHDRSGHRRSRPIKVPKALVNILFEMRTEMNTALDNAQSLFCIGFGFNDDHLQGVIKRRLAAGMPAILVTRDPTHKLLDDHPHVIALGMVQFVTGRVRLKCSEPIWQLDDFLKKFFETNMSIFHRSAFIGGSPQR